MSEKHDTYPAVRKNIHAAMRHELSDGIHSLSTCACHRLSTRAGRCLLCLAEDLAELYQRGATKQEAVTP